MQGDLACGTPVRDSAAGETLSYTLQFVTASAAMYRLLVVPDAGDPYVLAEHSDTQICHMHRSPIFPSRHRCACPRCCLRMLHGDYTIALINACLCPSVVPASLTDPALTALCTRTIAESQTDSRRISMPAFALQLASHSDRARFRAHYAHGCIIACVIYESITIFFALWDGYAI